MWNEKKKISAFQSRESSQLFSQDAFEKNSEIVKQKLRKENEATPGDLNSGKKALTEMKL